MRIAILSLVLAFTSSAAMAQPNVAISPPPPAMWKCSDFQHNADGSWSPRHAVRVNGVTMGPGVAFRPGVGFGGVDLGATLNQRCAGR
jgi:hypothetical protein